MRRLGSDAGTSGDDRVAWVDYAKGFCIVFVVMMHSTLGVENVLGQEGWLHTVVAFAKPFRMPGFFLISGLFLGRVIDRDWRTYCDRKVLHFVYFYLLWTAIQFASKGPVYVHEHGVAGTLWLYVESFWEPFSTLWFIYLLPVFFVVTKLARDLGIPPFAVWLASAALQSANIATGHTVIDEFASRYFFFYTGYLFAPRIFAFAANAGAYPETAIAALATWGFINGVLVFNGFAELPAVSLALSLAGAGGVVCLSALFAQTDIAKPLRFCGRNSIVIYLAFFLPMAITRTVIINTKWITDVGTMSAMVTLAGVTGSLGLFWVLRRTFVGFLFERPHCVRLASVKPRVLSPAR